MKVGPIALPVANARELVGFALLVVAVIYATKLLPVPPAVRKYLP